MLLSTTKTATIRFLISVWSLFLRPLLLRGSLEREVAFPEEVIAFGTDEEVPHHVTKIVDVRFGHADGK